MSRIYPFKNVGKLGKTALGKLSISHRFTGRVQLSNAGIGSNLSGINIVNSADNFSEQIEFNLDNFNSILDRSKIGVKQQYLYLHPLIFSSISLSVQILTMRKFGI